MSNRPRWILAALLLAGAGALVGALRLLPPAAAAGSPPLPGLAACPSIPRVGPGAIGEPGTFFTSEARLDAAGTLVGRRLSVGASGRVAAVADLPPESALTGPIDGVVVVSSDDGERSTVQLVAVAGGCSRTVHSTTSVVRRAILDPADGTLLLHLVSRATRADLGVWHLGLGAARAARVVEPLPASLGFGTVWATDLVLDAAGRMLAVQSCQDRECLSRIADLAAPARAPIILRGPGQGPILGFAGNRIVTWAACDGLPCGILEWDPAAAGPTELVADATGAGVTADGRLLIAVTSDGASDRAVVVDLVTGQLRPLHGLPTGERPVVRGGSAGTGLEVLPDQVAVSRLGAGLHAIRPSAAGEVLP